MRQLEQLVLDLRATNIADDIVSPEKAESEAQKLLLHKRRDAQTSSTIVGAMLSPPVAPPVFSESAGSWLAELKIFFEYYGHADAYVAGGEANAIICRQGVDGLAH
jgi:hypothetical protein